MSEQTRYLLNESDLPKYWYNINADSPVAPAPVLNPVTKELVTPEFLSVLFPMELIQQEVSTERYIQIPEEVRDVYKLWRPTPLYRAHRLHGRKLYAGAIDLRRKKSTGCPERRQAENAEGETQRVGEQDMQLPFGRAIALHNAGQHQHAGRQQHKQRRDRPRP